MKTQWLIATFLLIIFSANTLAAENSLEQRIIELEMRVKALEAQLTRRTIPVGLPEKAQQGFSGQYTESNSPAHRWIRFEPDGAFTLNGKTGQFKGRWRQSGEKLSIQAPAGFIEEFRIAGDIIMDSRGVEWIKTKGQ